MRYYLLMIYPAALLVLIFNKAKISRSKTVSDDFISLDQSKMIQASSCIAIILHHVTQDITVYGSAYKGQVTMLNYIGKRGHDIHTGVVDAYPSDWSQLFQYKSLPSILSYFEGATKQNGWQPSKPLTIKMQLTKYSYTADDFVVRLQIKSSAKASPQFIEIWMEDTDNDGKYDYYYPTNYLNLAHSLGVY